MKINKILFAPYFLMITFLTVFNEAHSCPIDTIYHYQLIGSTYTKTPADRTIYQRNTSNLPLSIIYQNWDNVNRIYLNVKKEEYTYNNFFPNKTTKILTSIYNTTSNSWVNDFLNQTSYDNFGNVTINQFSTWDAPNNNWKLLNEYAYTFNNNLLITEIHRMFNVSAGMVVNNIKYEMSYDANGNLLEKIKSNWTMSTGMWDLFQKQLYTYSSTNKQLTYEILYWNITGGWIGFSKTYYAYNGSGILIEQINQNYQVSSSSYVNFSKIQYIINSFDAIKSIYNFSWNEFINTWDSSIWSENNYNIKKQLDTVYKYIYNSGGDVWEKYGKTFYKYTSNGKLTETHIQDWITNNNNFQTKRYEYLSYNSNDSLIWDQVFVYSPTLNSMTQFTLSTYEYNNFNPIKIRESFSDYNSSTLIYNSANRYEYMCSSNTINNISIMNDNQIKVYPNPSHNGFIELSNLNNESEFQIMNHLGKVVLTGKISNGEKINLSSINNGIYFILVDFKVYKFIKQ